MLLQQSLFNLLSFLLLSLLLEPLLLLSPLFLLEQTVVELIEKSIDGSLINFSLPLAFSSAIQASSSPLLLTPFVSGGCPSVAVGNLAADVDLSAVF